MEVQKKQGGNAKGPAPAQGQVEKWPQDGEADDLEQNIPVDDAVRAYLHEIGRVPLLNEEQERALGNALHRGNVEVNRALRSLHARIRWPLLQREHGTLIDEAAAAWAALFDVDPVTLAATFRALLEHRARDDSSVTTAGHLIAEALQERDNWRGGIESLIRAMIDGDPRVLSGLEMLAALGGLDADSERMLAAFRPHVTFEEREVGAGDEGETEIVRLPYIDGTPYQEHPVAHATAQLLALGRAEADRLFELAQAEGPDPAILATHLAGMTGLPDADTRVALEGWSVDMTLVQRAQQARARLTEANLRLVVNVAKRYVNRGVPLLDLIQEGNFGLMRATELFDPSLGYRFSTYAIWWIKQSVLRGIATQARAVRLPVHVQQRLTLVARTRRDLTIELGREPTQSEIARHIGISEERLAADLLAGQEATSLETPVGDEEGSSSLGEFIEDESEPDIGEAVAQSMLRGELDRVLASLNEREQEVIRLRYGLVPDGRMRSLDEIGARFGISRERARQIEARAMQKLRRPSQSRQLRAYAL